MTESATSALSESTVRTFISELIVEIAPNSSIEIGSETRLVEDLEFHSLALMELAFTLEDEFELREIDEEAARAISTIVDVENHVIGELRERKMLS